LLGWRPTGVQGGKKVPEKSKSKVPGRVLIVGAGIIGASNAHHLARRGAGVTLIDRSGHSFGWINASFGNPEPYFRLRFQSLLEFRRLESKTAGALGVKWGGSP
jgi:glycine/D-amino acid oxidase-like deaminating enzyme